MADISGPTRSLPGALHNVPAGTMCDDHDDRPAVKRVQGETDSFGAEYIDWCQECYDNYLATKDEASVGLCDRCAGEAKLFAWRDWEEGSSGRVYHVCGDCRSRQADAAREELADSEEFSAVSFDWSDDEG